MAAGRAEAALPAAELGLEIWNVPAARPYAINEAEMLMLELRQRWPAAGMRDALARAMAQEAEMALGEAAAERAAVAERSAVAHAALVQAVTERALLGRQLELLQRMLTAQAARTSTQGAALSARPRLELDLTRVQRAVLRTQEEQAAVEAELRALLGLGPAQALGEPARADEHSVAEETLAQLASRASAQRGMAAAARARQAAASARVQAARAQARRPEVMLGLGLWQALDMRPGLGVTAAVSLPWLWGPAPARLAQARADEDAARAQSVAQDREAQAELEMAVARLRATEAQLAELRTVALPAAHRTVEGLTAAYATGALPLTDWIDGAQLVLELELEEAALLGQHAKALAALDRAVGVALPRVPLSAPGGGASQKEQP